MNRCVCCFLLGCLMLLMAVSCTDRKVPETETAGSTEDRNTAERDIVTEETNRTASCYLYGFCLNRNSYQKFLTVEFQYRVDDEEGAQNYNASEKKHTFYAEHVLYVIADVERKGNNQGTIVRDYNNYRKGTLIYGVSIWDEYRDYKMYQFKNIRIIFEKGYEIPDWVKKNLDDFGITYSFMKYEVDLNFK